MIEPDCIWTVGKHHYTRDWFEYQAYLENEGIPYNDNGEFISKSYLKTITIDKLLVLLGRGDTAAKDQSISLLREENNLLRDRMAQSIGTCSRCGEPIGLETHYCNPAKVANKSTTARKG